MSNPTIKFSADVSAVTKAIDAVNAKAAEVNSTLNAGTVGIDVSNAQKQLDGLLHTVEELTNATKEAANAGAELDFDAVSKSAAEATKQAEALGSAINKQGSGSAIQKQVADLNGLHDTIERVRKVQDALAREGIQLSRRQTIEAKRRYDEWRKSGASGTRRIRDVQMDDFVRGDWRKTALAEIDARRFRRNVLGAAGIDFPSAASPAGPRAAAGTRGKAHEEETPAKARTLAQFAAGAMRDAMGSVGGAIMPGSMGIGGRLAGRGIAEAAGTEGGLLSGAGISRLAMGAGIGALAFGAVKAFGAVRAKVGDAENESITYTDLRHSIGETRTDFDLLRAALRDAAKGLGVANSEVVQLGAQFARVSGGGGAGGGGGERGLGADVRTSIGFARGYGLDPMMGIGLFATARHYGVTSNDAENRRLAMMIGDAVGRSGSFARMPDMIATLEGFMGRAGRSTLGAAPNTAAFMDEMAKLTGMRMSGMDTAGAGALLSQITNAWHSGGGMGMASRNFRLSAFSRALPGFDAYDLDVVDAADPFSTVGQAFGEKSAPYRAALARGDQARLAQLRSFTSAAGNRQLIDIDYDQVSREYGGNTKALTEALMQHWSLNSNQASSYIASQAQGDAIGLTSARLHELGIDPRAMSTDFAALAQMNGANADDLRKAARSYLKDDSVSPELRGALKSRLDGANGDDGVEALRNSLIQMAAMVGSPKDEGEGVRSSVVDLKNITQNMASHLVPYTNDIRDGILALAKKLAPGDRVDAIEKREFSPAERNIKDQYGKALQARDAAAAAVDAGPAAAVAALDKQIADFKHEHTDRNTHALTLNSAQRAKLAGLEKARAAAAGADYSAKKQAELDAANKHLAEVREEAATAAEKAGPQFRDWAFTLGDGTADARIAAQNNLSHHLGNLVGGPKNTAAAKDRKAFADKFGKAAALAAVKLGVDSNVILGQWAQETGWGKHIIPNTNNLGNIKSFSGKGVSAVDNMMGTTDRYVSYSSPEEFASAYADLVARRFPGAVGAGSDAARFARGLQAGGYAEDPDYVSKTVRVYRSLTAAHPARDVALPGGSFGNMPMPTASPVALGPSGAMSSAVQRYAFDHKITLVDQHGKPRAAPAFTTVQTNPVPSGMAN